MTSRAAGAAVLVTGATGVIGTWAVRHLAANGLRVTATDLLGADGGDPGAPGVEFHPGDLTDAEFVVRLLSARRFDAIVHLAGLLQFACEHDPGLAVRVNVDATRTVLEAARRTGVRRVILASSVAVFGAQDETVTETSPLLPPRAGYGVYAATKLLAERVGLAFHANAGGPEYVVFRLAAVFGLGRPRSTGMSDVLQRLYGGLLAGRAVEVSELSGHEYRHFVHVKDICGALVAALRHRDDISGVYNLAGPPELYVTVGAFADAVTVLAGRGGTATFSGSAASGARLDVTRIERRIGFVPTTNLPAAVATDRQWLEHRTGGARRDALHER